MVKVDCCDICYGESKKLTKSWKGLSIKGRPELKTSFCQECEHKIPDIKKVGMSGFIKWRWQLDGIELTDEQANQRATNRY